MSKESYFAQYVSPNIVIVPTLSFLPPSKENKTIPITNTSCCEQNSSKTSTSSSNSGNNITKEANCNIADTGTLELNNPHRQNIIISPTEEQGKNMNQNKELSSNKFKSRNNLVDFTGFNINKRDSSLTKPKDSERKQLKTEQNIVKGIDKRDNLGSVTNTKNMKTYKESSKCEGVLNSLCKENSKDNTSSGSKKEKIDMEDKMKKYLKQLWKRNIEKLIDKSDNEKQNTGVKSFNTKQNCKVSKREPIQIKSRNLKPELAAKRTVTKTLKNKTIDTSTSKYSSRSKRESKCSLQFRDREGFLNPESIKRYKNFQRFIRHNENGVDSNYKTDKQNKKEHSHDSTKLLKSNKSNMSPAEPKKLVERKQSVKSDLVKSVVTQVHKNLPKSDLRARLSRKRTRSECLTHSQQILENKMDREDLVITVQQDVKTDPKAPKSKPKKCKKIKLVINIECPTSDSDDSDQNVDECCTSPQDLSFLDDFDVDEIVDLLNTNHSQADGSINASEKSHEINNTNEKEQHIKNNQETKPKGRLIKPTNIKTSKINKVKNNNYDKLAGDKNDRNEKEIKTNSSNSNRGESNIKKPNDKNRESSVTAVKKSRKIINGNTKEVNTTRNIKPLTESNTNSTTTKQQQQQTNKNTIKVSRIREGRIKKSLSTAKNCNMKVAKSVSASLLNMTRAGDSIEASLENMFNNIGQSSSIKTDDSQFHISKKQANEQHIKKIEDTLEASLDNMFNNIKKETKTTNSQHIKQEEIISTTQQITKEHNNQNKNNQSKMTMINNTDKHIKLEPEQLHFEASTEHLQTSKTNEKSLENPINISNKSDQDDVFYRSENEEKNPQITLSTSLKSNVVKDTKTDKQANVTSLSKSHNKEKVCDSKKSKGNIIKSLEKPSNSSVSKTKEGSIYSLQASNKNTKQKHLLNSEQISKKSTITKNNIAEYNVDNQIDTRTLSKTNEKEEKQNSNETVVPTINIKATNVETNSENANKNSNLKISNHTIKSSVAVINNNISEQKTNMEMDVEMPVKNLNEKAEHLQKSETIEKVQDIPINSKHPINSEQTIDEKAETHSNSCENIRHETKIKTNFEKEIKIQMVIESPNIYNVDAKENGEHLINSTTAVKEQYISISTNETSNKTHMNIKENAKLIQNLTDISKNTPETSIDNIKEKSNIKTDIKYSNESKKTVSNNLKDDTRNTCLEIMISNAEETASNISNKKIEKETNNLQQTESTSSKKSPKIVNDTIVQNNNITTNVELPSNVNKNVGSESFSGKPEVTTKKSIPTVDTEKDSMVCEKPSIKTGAKSNTEDKHENFPEKVANCLKPQTIHDDLSKDSKIKNTEINNKSNKFVKIETNVKIKQKQVDFNDKMVTNGAQKNQETKSDKVQNKGPAETGLFVKKMEQRMLNYLDKQYTVTSLVHKGRFSKIYKCRDVKGENYAVKVMNGTSLKNTGICMENMLTQLQEYRSIRDLSILGLINGFGVQGFWCLLTNYYPKNLEEALKENRKSFHIELVQVLARQLIAAVNMLTNNNIIHSDIKPTHILLNSNNDRLKLCGFERADYRDHIYITPKTGTPSYRAPEVILGFSEDFKIDVWSTALVIFEMATNIKLFPGQFNNDILYKQICTLGSFDWEMMEYCRYKHLHFKGLSFMRQVGYKGENIVLVHAFHKNKRLRKQLYKSARSLTGNKIEQLHTLLEQMLVLDPRHRLPIQFAGVSEFIDDVFT